MLFLYNFLQDEWELILNFIVTFPSVIKSTVPKITLKSHNVIIQTNKVNLHAELHNSTWSDFLMTLKWKRANETETTDERK